MEMIPIPGRKGVSSDKQELEQVINRMLDPFEDEPGFASLKNLFLRPLVDSEATARIMERLSYGLFKFRSRECTEILIFDVLLDYMSLRKKARHVGPLVYMFKCLLGRHQSNCSETAKPCFRALDCAEKFTMLYVELSSRRGVEDDDDTSRELVWFVEYVVLTTPMRLKRLLLRADTAGMLGYLLACFSKERFHAYNIRKSDFLMKNIEVDISSMLNAIHLSRERMSNALLIRHGFEYRFDEGYYAILVRKLIKARSVSEENPEDDILSAFMDSGNLRMQIAVEILVHHLYGEERNRELLCMLWQSLPDPFITPDELYHLMEPFQTFFVQDSLLVDAGPRYMELIPGVPEVKQPRSLKHLARVQIRESMVRAHSIGEKAIESLGLPKTIQDYLWKLEAF